MPLQIGSLPIHEPHVAGFQITSFRDGLLDFLRRIIPALPDLEDFDASAVEAEAEIKPATEVNRRLTLSDERRNGVFDTLPLYVVHRISLVCGARLSRGCTEDSAAEEARHTEDARSRAYQRTAWANRRLG